MNAALSIMTYFKNMFYIRSKISKFLAKCAVSQRIWKRHSYLALLAGAALFAGACTRPIYTETIEFPELASVNVIDRNGITETITNPERLEQFECVDFLSNQPYQKIMRVYNRDRCGNIYSYITSYYPNGQVKQYLEVLNGRATGSYVEWHQNGAKKLEGRLVGGMADIVSGSEITWIFDGCCQVWDEQGNTLAQFSYAYGSLNGQATYYHPNGSIMKQVFYVNGLPEGAYYLFGNEGQLLQTSLYVEGKRDGEAVYYYCDGSIAAEEEYCAGLLVRGEYYDHDGNSISQVAEGDGVRSLFDNGTYLGTQEFRHGNAEGEVRIVDPNGFLVRIFHEKDQVKHGEEILFYERKLNRNAPMPKLSITWYQGKIQGVSKTWYDNGVQESQRELSNNMKNGLSTAWYREGSLMMVEEYEQDLLVKGDYFQKGDRFPVSQVVEGTGVATLFDPEGIFIRKINYVKGKPQ